MQLWNDYEGRTIAEAYPLEKLLSPEGRSAFFSTSNGTGNPAVIRLIEPHFDDAEILSRWRQVAELHDPHLITLRKYGQTELDGTSLVYAVMEPSDDNLAAILKQRPLTLQETREVAVSLVAALQALHTHNLIHEHLEPANVLATGDLIKLRSDCVREVPSGEEADRDAAALRAQDVHDLALVLLQALTLRSVLPATPLPAPFDAIIRNGTSGTWGLAEISAALTPPAAPASRPAAPASRPAAPAPAPAPKPPTPTQSTLPKTVPAPSFAPNVSDRLIRPVEDLPSRARGLWIAGGVGILLLLVLLWHHFSAAPVAAPSSSAPPPARATPAPAPAPAPASATEPKAKPATAETSANPAPAPATGTRSHWRVVAFTFNHQDQAQKKADELATRYASLHPGVFSPSGHAPYLVTLGGPMPRDQATALRNQARAAGLPRDTYIQNYPR
jgi:hypothetical protein